MRYVIIGAGAIGGGLGGRLAQAGADVVLVARGEHLRALRVRGLRLRTPTEDVTVPVRAVAGPDELELAPDDVLVVATKTQQAEAALVAWADAPVRAGGRELGAAGDVLPVLMALNGVASETLALRYFARVYGVCVWMPAGHLTPGEVIIRGAPTSGMLHVGRVPVTAANEADAHLLDAIVAEWSVAGFDVPTPPDVMAWKYRKLLSNLGNGIQALVGNDADRAQVATIEAALDAEARALLDAAGIACTDDAEESAARAAGFTMHDVPGVPRDLGGSTWQSLTRGTGNVETDFLNGEIVLIAHQLGRRAPVNGALASLVRRAAAAGQRPGELSVEALRAALGLAADEVGPVDQ